MAISLLTLFLALAFHVPSLSDSAHAPIAELGITKTEAQPIVAEPGLPLHLSIPAINVEAAIVPVGLTDTKRMEVPEKPDDVGWYRFGALPGEEGNAVLAGHLDIGQTKGIFWDLHLLTPGDEIVVTDEKGVARTFRVRQKKTYDVRNAPMPEIFGSADMHALNLITCAGIWDPSLDHYDKRLVVFTEEVL